MIGYLCITGLRLALLLNFKNARLEVGGGSSADDVSQLSVTFV